MTKVITYGTYDLLHYGHIRLLQRAKQLGDYLIIGVTADDFDKSRGKINVQQSLMDRVEAIRATGIADEIIIEEYEGQKIDDIIKYDIDIFTVGSDWKGYFDYLNEYCKVIYLERTEGVSSSEIRKKKRNINLGLIGNGVFLNKVINETQFVNGVQCSAICTKKFDDFHQINNFVSNFEELIESSDAIYTRSLPKEHYEQIKIALNKGKHVLCESPISINPEHTKELFSLAKKNNVILMEAIKTAYSTAFSRLILLAKGGKIGDIVSVDATCTSLKRENSDWNGFFEWGPTALLPVFKLLGTKPKEFRIITRENSDCQGDFSKIDFIFEKAVASIKIGNGVKSEGEMIISGTNGYIYVPSPWWKTDYFEIRYENTSENKRYFYQLDGEGIRYELVAFTKSIENGKSLTNISEDISLAISNIAMSYINKKNTIILKNK